MIVTLPMYDRPETAAANDRLLAALREVLPQAPKQLSRDDTHWMHPDLLLSQTCSLPFRIALQNHTQIVAAPVHNLACPKGYYFSEVVVRKDDQRVDFKAFHGSVAAVNSPVSQSGWAALDHLTGLEGVTFGSLIETGSHLASARAVAEGRADIAAIDAVSWQMITRWDSFTKDLKVLTETQPTPALPFITGPNHNPALLRDALLNAVRALSEEDRTTLCLHDITTVPPAKYVLQPIPPAPSFAVHSP